MKKLNPIERSQYIDGKYKEYLKSSFEFGKSHLQKLFVEQLEKEKLFKGPYVDLSFPFQRGKNLESLIEEGVVCESFKRLDDINLLGLCTLTRKSPFAPLERAIVRLSRLVLVLVKQKVSYIQY